MLFKLVFRPPRPSGEPGNNPTDTLWCCCLCVVQLCPGLLRASDDPCSNPIVAIILFFIIIIIIIINPLTARVVWAPQMILQPVFSIFSLFSTALWDLPNSRPVHSLMLSSHLFLCPCLLPPFTVPCKMVLARPDERETWPYHCSLRLFTMVRRSLCVPVACWILARTFSFVFHVLSRLHLDSSLSSCELCNNPVVRIVFLWQ